MDIARDDATGDDVIYVSGYQYSSGSTLRPVYWRVQDTSIIPRVLNYTTDSEAYDIFVVEDHEPNSDIVYAAGYYEDDGSMNDAYNACYWKDEGGDGVGIVKYILPSAPEEGEDGNWSVEIDISDLDNEAYPIASGEGMKEVIEEWGKYGDESSLTVIYGKKVK